jgi:hypothetical protein
MSEPIIDMRLVRFGDPWCSRAVHGCQCCIYVPEVERMTSKRLLELKAMLRSNSTAIVLPPAQPNH